MNKVLIEESTPELLELFEQVSEEARSEKNAVPPINEMLYWWTRKPLVVGRAISLVSTLDDLQTVKDLLGLRREKRAYTYIPDVGLYKKKIGTDPSKIKVLDPFGGAGNLIFEAKRLGLDCSISDYNPVAYLLEKAVLEYPAKYGIKLAEDFEKYANLLIQKTEMNLNKFYNERDLAYLWIWCIKCPHCGQRVPLTNQMYIANTTKNKIGVKFTPSNKNFTVELIHNMKFGDGKKFTQKGGSAICINCKNTIDYETLASDIAKRKDREMIVKLIQEQKKREYVEPTEQDRKLFKKASEDMKSKFDEYEKENLIPNEDILPSHRRENMLWHYGITHWHNFYSDRQLLVMTTLLKNIKSICDGIIDKEFAKIISLYLSFIVCKHVDVNALCTIWNVGGEKPEPVLALRRPAMIFNHVEINPFNKIRGSLINIVNSIKTAIAFSALNNGDISISLKSVLKLNSNSLNYDLIITDPPYLADVQYGELSEFFYVWISRILQKYYPELPSRVKLDEDICESWGRFGDKKLAQQFFEKGFKNAFISMNKILNDDGLLIVFFAHSSVQAWNLLLESLRDSKFYVKSSYAIHTEHPTSLITRGKTSFMSSVVVACRKIKHESTVYYEDIIPELEDKIKKILATISVPRLLSIPLTDLLIMVYGKILEVTTNHTTIKSYNKDFSPTNFENLIYNARDYVMKEIVTKLTGRSLNTLGSSMSFYLLTKIFYQGILTGDESIKATRTFGLDEITLEKNNTGKKKSGSFELNYLNEVEINKKPEEIDKKNLHEQLCYLCYILNNNNGSEKISSILTNTNFRIDDLKLVISLILKSYRLRMNKAESLNTEEQKELKLLETLADILGVKPEDRSKGSLDSFMK